MKFWSLWNNEKKRSWGRVLLFMEREAFWYCTKVLEQDSPSSFSKRFGNWNSSNEWQAEMAWMINRWLIGRYWSNNGQKIGWSWLLYVKEAKNWEDLKIIEKLLSLSKSEWMKWIIWIVFKSESLWNFFRNKSKKSFSEALSANIAEFNPKQS